MIIRNVFPIDTKSYLIKFDRIFKHRKSLFQSSHLQLTIYSPKMPKYSMICYDIFGKINLLRRKFIKRRNNFATLTCNLCKKSGK